MLKSEIIFSQTFRILIGLEELLFTLKKINRCLQLGAPKVLKRPFIEVILHTVQGNGYATGVKGDSLCSHGACNPVRKRDCNQVSKQLQL